VQFDKIRRTHKPLDDFTALVHQKSGGCELDISPSAGNTTGVVATLKGN
jgi:hypothetical protein